MVRLQDIDNEPHLAYEIRQTIPICSKHDDENRVQDSLPGSWGSGPILLCLDHDVVRKECGSNRSVLYGRVIE